MVPHRQNKNRKLLTHGIVGFALRRGYINNLISMQSHTHAHSRVIMIWFSQSLEVQTNTDTMLVEKKTWKAELSREPEV